MSCSSENIPSVSSISDDCPVCLCSPSEAQVLFVQGPCGHALCQPCMERILLTQPNSIPTRGLCPICRCPVNLFDLVLHKNPQQVLYPARDTNIRDCPIGGLSYVGRPEGGPTFHFTQNVPYVVTALEQKQIPFETFHWHAKSRTFHGTLTEDAGRDWDVVLQFSSDLRYISNGIVIQTSRNGPDHHYPLDGEWLVQWESGAMAAIYVMNNVFHFGPYRYEVDLSNRQEIKFEWPSPLGVIQTAVEGINLDSQPQGPPVGSQVVWRTSQNERIVWTRESMGGEHVERLGPGGRMYRRVDASSRTRPTYHGDCLWGNTFCQAFKVGLASYQFLSLQEGAYISYENPLCARWPPLDDGTPIPSQVYFKNISFDESERVFRGTIEWQQEYGTTWQGCSKWMYTIKFDTEYTCILSGEVKSIFHGNEEDEQDMSTFGVDLVYINAAITQYFDTLMSDSNEEESDYDRYVRTSQNLRARLQQEGASVRTIATMNHVLTVAQQPDLNDPIDYNLS